MTFTRRKCTRVLKLSVVYHFFVLKISVVYREKHIVSFDLISGIEDVMRADIIRLVAIHHYGGVYFDLDTVSVKPLDNFVETHNCSLVFEPSEHFLMQNTDFLLTNSALLCACNHSFYEKFIAAINALPNTCKHAFNCTGPRMLSNFYQKLNHINGNTNDLPKIESSEIFQDVYDHRSQTAFVTKYCKDRSKLRPFEVKICDNWKQRGKEKRSLSPLALTYHTWYHVYGRKMTVLRANSIERLVPHVKIYGRNVFT